MNTNQDQLIQLELPLDELGWLRAFLDQERGVAEVDRANARDFHNARLPAPLRECSTARSKR